MRAWACRFHPPSDCGMKSTKACKILQGGIRGEEGGGEGDKARVIGGPREHSTRDQRVKVHALYPGK